MAAGEAAAVHVQDGMRLGLGTGSTVEYFLRALAHRIQRDSISVEGVPTSIRTRDRCAELGIPTLSLADAPQLDLAVDGADEVDPRLDLIKGLGGALLREKMVAQAARDFIVIADGSKTVERLGTRSPLPVEVVTFGWECHVPFLASWGAEARLRPGSDGQPYLTDNGNYILDAEFTGGIADPAALDAALQARAGVVDNGLFLGMASTALISNVDGDRAIRVQTVRRDG